CGEARVLGEMVTAERSARSQRRRWEGGRSFLIRRSLPALCLAAVRRPSKVCADLACDLLIPPLATLAALVLALSVLSVLTERAFPSGVTGWLCVIDILVLATYVLRGWALSGTGLRGLIDLLRAPAF